MNEYATRKELAIGTAQTVVLVVFLILLALVWLPVSLSLELKERIQEWLTK